jgi:hypothetical protein
MGHVMATTAAHHRASRLDASSRNLTARNWGQAGTVNYTVADLDLIAIQGPLANGAILEHESVCGVLAEAGSCVMSHSTNVVGSK